MEGPKIKFGLLICFRSDKYFVLFEDRYQLKKRALDLTRAGYTVTLMKWDTDNQLFYDTTTL